MYRADPETRKPQKQVSACCAAQTCNARKVRLSGRPCLQPFCKHSGNKQDSARTSNGSRIHEMAELWTVRQRRHKTARFGREQQLPRRDRCRRGAPADCGARSRLLSTSDRRRGS
jgi:hypothetical protein